MRPLLSLALKGWTSGSSWNRDCRNCFTQFRTSSHGLELPVRVHPNSERLPLCVNHEWNTGSSSPEVSSPTASPHSLLRPIGLRTSTSTRRLTSTGFLNLLTLHSLESASHISGQIRSWGCSLQSFVPLVQPYSVSSASTLMTLGNVWPTTN